MSMVAAQEAAVSRQGQVRRGQEEEIHFSRGEGTGGGRASEEENKLIAAAAAGGYGGRCAR